MIVSLRVWGALLGLDRTVLCFDEKAQGGPKVKKPVIFLVGNGDAFLQRLSSLLLRERVDTLVLQNVSDVLAFLRQKRAPTLLIVMVEEHDEELKIISLL